MVRDAASRLLTMRVWLGATCSILTLRSGAFAASRRVGPARTAATTPHSRGTNCPGDAATSALESQRAQGMPDAGRTREPCVQKSVHSAHARNHRAAATTGTPCAMVLTAAPRSPRCTGLFSHRRPRQSSRRLDPSVGGTGPHGLTVREKAFVHAPKCAEHPHVHRIPLPTSVTIAIRPLCPENLTECANGRFSQNRPLLELSPLRP